MDKADHLPRQFILRGLNVNVRPDYAELYAKFK